MNTLYLDDSYSTQAFMPPTYAINKIRGNNMENLLNVLQGIIEKYNVTPEDFAAIQEAISELENGASEEFAYPEDKIEDSVAE